MVVDARNPDRTIIRLEPPMAREGRDGRRPSFARVLGVLPRREAAAITWKEIGDRTAAEGWPLKKRTILEACAALRDEGPVDAVEIDGRGTLAFWKKTD